MNPIEIILIIIIAAAVIAAVIFAVRKRRKGGCSCGCEGCSLPCEHRRKQS